MDNQYKKSIEKLLSGIFEAAGKANIITTDGINYEVVNKSNLITTGMAEKDTIFETLNINPGAKMMINGLLSSFGGMAAKGKVINFDLNIVKHAAICFFSENSHLIEGLPELIEKIKIDLDSRKTKK